MKNATIFLLPLASLLACGSGAEQASSPEVIEAAVGGQITKCAVGRLYFNGACRQAIYFANRVSPGADFVAAMGSDVIPACPSGVCPSSEISLVEERKGQVSSIRLSDDAHAPAGTIVAGIRHDNGFRITLETQHVFLPVEDAYYHSLVRTFLPRRVGAPGAQVWQLVQTGWHSDEKRYDSYHIICGTDIALENETIGFSGECQEWLEQASGASTDVCEALAEMVDTVATVNCATLAVGGAIILTQPETIVTLGLTMGTSSLAVDTCFKLGNTVGDAVRDICAVAPVDGCGLDSGGALPGLITVDGPSLDLGTIVGSDMSTHNDCTLSTEVHQACTINGDGDCTCTTMSSCSRISCTDGYSDEYGDC